MSAGQHPEEPRRYRRFGVDHVAELSSHGKLMVCPGREIGVGGCSVTVLFPLQRGEQVFVRLRSAHSGSEPAGMASVAWASRNPPYRAGLAFSNPMAERVVPFLTAAVGPVPLSTARR